MAGYRKMGEVEVTPLGFRTPSGAIAEVSSSLSGGKWWIAVLRTPGRKGFHRIKSKRLPERNNFLAAAEDLARYAAEKGWPRLEGEVER